MPLGKGGNRISKKNAGLPDTLNSKEGLVGGAGNLLFNLELAKQPVECVEYVVAQELAHLLERTHNGVFQTLLNQHLPNWRILRERLSETPIAVVL